MLAGNIGPSPSTSLQFTVLQLQVAKKSLKTPILGVQGHTKSRCWYC